MQRQFPVVLLEFNELSPALMDRFTAEGQLPNFAALRDGSEVYISHTEEEPPFLEPWIQWVSVHTGVPYAEHGIFRLSEGHKLRHKNVWDLASDAGLPVWVCGSMNIRYDASIKGYMLPDPWSTDVAPHPDTLLPYFRFVQQNVLEYTNDRVPLTRSDYQKFLGFMLGHGLSLHTVSSILGQLASEKTSGKGRWRRAFILDKLQFDLFAAVYRRLRPRFSTFFLNSTAHMQHMYWRNMEPELFKLPVGAEQSQFSTAILLGYQEMDRLIGRTLKVVGDNAIVIMATALSQQPCLKYEEGGGKHGYRPKDFSALLNFAGVKCGYRVAPVMSEQFWIRTDSEADAAEVQTKLTAVMAGSRQAMQTRREGTALFAGCAINQALDRKTVLQVAGTGRSIPFFEMFYEIEGLKSGMHHPDGILWIRHPERPHRVHAEKVSLTSIAPTILEMLRVQQPDYVKGTSLLSASVAGTPAPDYAMQ